MSSQHVRTVAICREQRVQQTTDIVVMAATRHTERTYNYTVSQSRTATRSCRDPETRISFLVARWRPTQAHRAASAAACAAAVAAMCRQGVSL